MSERTRISCVGFEQEQADAIAEIDKELELINNNLIRLANRKVEISQGNAKTSKIRENVKGQADIAIREDADPRILRKIEREDKAERIANQASRQSEVSSAASMIEKHAHQSIKNISDPLTLQSQTAIRNALSTIYKNNTILIDFVEEVNFDVIVKALRRLTTETTPSRSGKPSPVPAGKLTAEDLDKIGRNVGPKIDPGPLVKKGSLEPKTGSSHKEVFDQLKQNLSLTTSFGHYVRKRLAIENKKQQETTSRSLRAMIEEDKAGRPIEGLDEVDEFLEEVTEQQSNFTLEDLRLKYQGDNLSSVSDLPGSPGSKEEFDSMYNANPGQEIVEGGPNYGSQTADELFEESLIGKSAIEKAALRDANASFRDLEKLQALGPKREQALNDFMTCRLAGLNDVPL